MLEFGIGCCGGVSFDFRWVGGLGFRLIGLGLSVWCWALVGLCGIDLFLLFGVLLLY